MLHKESALPPGSALARIQDKKSGLIMTFAYFRLSALSLALAIESSFEETISQPLSLFPAKVAPKPRRTEKPAPYLSLISSFLRSQVARLTMSIKSSTNPETFLTGCFTDDWLLVNCVSHDSSPLLKHYTVLPPVFMPIEVGGALFGEILRDFRIDCGVIKNWLLSVLSGWVSQSTTATYYRC